MMIDRLQGMIDWLQFSCYRPFWIIYWILTVFEILYSLDMSSVHERGEAPLRKDVADA